MWEHAFAHALTRVCMRAHRIYSTALSILSPVTSWWRPSPHSLPRRLQRGDADETKLSWWWGHAYGRCTSPSSLPHLQRRDSDRRGGGGYSGYHFDGVLGGGEREKKNREKEFQIRGTGFSQHFLLLLHHLYLQKM